MRKSNSVGVPVVFKRAVYWPTGKGVIVSRDQGASWSDFGTPVEATHGPLFGSDENRCVVIGKSGFIESTDGGITWKVVAPLPPGFTTNRVGPNFA